MYEWGRVAASQGVMHRRYGGAPTREGVGRVWGGVDTLQRPVPVMMMMRRSLGRVWGWIAVRGYGGVILWWRRRRKGKI